MYNLVNRYIKESLDMKNINECRVLIVEDESEIRKMLKGILNKEGFLKILEACSCREAMEKFKLENPEGVILDVMLPDGDGFSVMRDIRKISNVPVLFLSAKDEDEDRLLGLGLGADDYITKPFLPRELILRLKAVLNRAYFPIGLKSSERPVFYLGECKIDLNSGVVINSGKKHNLTAKEFVIIEKLYQNMGKIVTGDMLCQAAWNDSLYGYENTLMVHIRRLREKIELEPSSPKHLLTVRGLGYKLVGGKDE